MKEKYNFSKKSGKNFETLTFFQTPKMKVSGENRKEKKNKIPISDPTASNLSAKCRAVKRLEFILNNNFILSDKNTHLTFEITNKLVDYKGLRKCLDNFIKTLRSDHSNFKYVWVLDTNKQGFFHIHMLINIYFDKDEQKELSKKWHKKVCRYYKLDKDINEKICNLHFTRIFELDHLEGVFHYFMSKPRNTYPLKEIKDKNKYSSSKNLEKETKSNGLIPFNVREKKKALEDKYGKINVQLNSYYDYYAETKIYQFKLYKGRFSE